MELSIFRKIAVAIAIGIAAHGAVAGPGVGRNTAYDFKDVNMFAARTGPGIG